jgi:hypothetical protein
VTCAVPDNVGERDDVFVTEPVAVVVIEEDGDAALVKDGVCVPDPVAEADAVFVCELEAVCEGVPDALKVAEGVMLPVCEAVADCGEADAVILAVMLPLDVRVPLTLAVAEAVVEAFIVGKAVMLAV